MFYLGFVSVFFGLRIKKKQIPEKYDIIQGIKRFAAFFRASERN